MRQLFSNTEPCIDLKLITLNPGRLYEGEYLDGTIVRDGEEHYTFIQTPDAQPSASAAAAAICPIGQTSAAICPIGQPSAATAPTEVVRVQRNPIIYRGRYINVHRAKDGRLYPTFCRPALTDRPTFALFCQEAASELMRVSSLIEKMMPGRRA